jgi:hypothetical protein
MAWIELNATNPAPPAGAQNVHFRADETHLGTQADPTPVSAYYMPPITVRFMIANGSAGTNVALNDDAEVAGTVSTCTVVVTRSAAAVDLTFKIRKNGTDVFSADPTVAAGAAAGSKFEFTNLTSSPLAITAGDIFTMDITSGTSDWKFIAKLE